MRHSTGGFGAAEGARQGGVSAWIRSGRTGSEQDCQQGASDTSSHRCASSEPAGAGEVEKQIYCSAFAGRKARGPRSDQGRGRKEARPNPKTQGKGDNFPRASRKSLSLPPILPPFLSLSLSLSLSLPLPLSRSRFFSRARAFLLRAALCSLCLPGEASELEEEEEEGGDTCNTVLGDASCRRGDGTGIIAMGEANCPQWPS